MKKIVYKIEFFTYWLSGTGLSGGVEASELAAKDENGLPFIPGRTLKGLLSDAAQSLNELPSQLVSTDFIQTIFGIGADKLSEKDKYSVKGQCHFSNAQLSSSIAQRLQADQKAFLFKTLASTAIDDDGQAKDFTLRQKEVAIPLTLYATIEDFPSNPAYLDQLNWCFQWVKKMGINRNRGLGRCSISLYNPTK